VFVQQWRRVLEAPFGQRRQGLGEAGVPGEQRAVLAQHRQPPQTGGRRDVGQGTVHIEQDLDDRRCEIG
jgi:hypothetical protein